ncbi:tyrosinase family oxidase copper chaperone [Streptomyces sp. NPDC058280]|uniref:tyrosinase family oxidase copper chaperone n=1 Tax=Streptomyces sp. NPDC058280 TaxID=3346419 RepID=UPI0036EB6D2C
MEPRRHFLRAVFTFGVVAGTATALAPILGARRAASEAGGAVPGADDKPGGGAVDEMYRGRHIQVAGPDTAAASRAATSSAPSASAVPPLSPASAVDIRIDGRPLQVMRRADGSYLSVVNHYESFPTPLEVARAAVDDLDGAQLSLSGPNHHI